MSNKINLQSIKKYMSNGIFYCKKHKTHDLYIFNYDDDLKESIIWDDINLNLKGLVLDEEGNIFNRPVKKFFTVRDMMPNKQLLLSNGELLNYENKKYKVFDKIEGHLCYLFWYKNEPIITSYKSFDCTLSEIAHAILHDTYKDVLTKLDTSKTYVFELIAPQYRLIVDYKLTKDLILIAVVDQVTGELESISETGFKTPIQFKDMEIEELNSIKGSNREGVIIYFETGEMVKLKTKWYDTAAKLLQSIDKCREKEVFFKEKFKKLMSKTRDRTLMAKESPKSLDHNKELELSDFLTEILQE